MTGVNVEASTTVALVAGWTAGHVYPALSVAEALRRLPDAPRVLFIAGRDGPAAHALREAGDTLAFVSGSPIKGAGAPGVIRAAANVARSLSQSRALLRRERPAIVIGFGSYVTGGVVLAAKSLGIRTAIHEANVRPGLANRLLSPFVDRVYLASAEARPYFPAARTVVVGMPVRESMRSARAQAPDGRSAHLLVASSSRGEAFLAREVPALVAALAREGLSISVTHQTGSAAAEDLRRAYASAGVAADVVPFITDVASGYRRAHVAIVRGGASTLAELSSAGLPAIVVPLADASDDHQRANGDAFQAAGAGLCLPEDRWSVDAAASWAGALLREPRNWQRASEAARALSNDAAAAQLAADCLGLIA